MLDWNEDIDEDWRRIWEAESRLYVRDATGGRCWLWWQIREEIRDGRRVYVDASDAELASGMQWDSLREAQAGLAEAHLAAWRNVEEEAGE